MCIACDHASPCNHIDYHVSIGKEKVQALYEDFVHHSGSWARGCIYREIIGRRSHKAQGVRKWLTRPQLLEHYTEDQVESIVLRKESDPDLLLAQVQAPHLEFVSSPNAHLLVPCPTSTVP